MRQHAAKIVWSMIAALALLAATLWSEALGQTPRQAWISGYCHTDFQDGATEALSTGQAEVATSYFMNPDVECYFLPILGVRPQPALVGSYSGELFMIEGSCYQWREIRFLSAPGEEHWVAWFPCEDEPVPEDAEGDHA